MCRRNEILSYLAAICLWLPPVAASALTAKQMVAQADSQMRGSTATGVYEMTIVHPDWRRDLRLRFWEDVDSERAFVRVLSPPREAGSASLKLGNEMWSYLPSVERSMKIPSSMMSQSWMGSDLTNEDIVNGEHYIDLYDHAVTDTTEVAGTVVYEITSTPRADAAVVWGQILYYARREDFLPVRQVFLDEDGQHIRRMDFSDFKVVGKRTIPTRYIVTPLTEEADGRQTTLLIRQMRFDEPIPVDTFTRRNLERPR